MAITPTPAHYEGFVYGAVDSHTYGVVISDTNAYDSAGRAVEMITIPGRNGAYAMDHKRYENIEVTYHCSIPATDPADFISAISDLRNALGALTGYNRLTDDFNDNEYRMAVLKGGVGVTNINPQAGTFDVVFDCKPQRFLTSGETAQTVTSGDTITNLTLYDAKPLLHVTGYGAIDLRDSNGDSITGNMVIDSPGDVGTIRIAEQGFSPQPYVVIYTTLDTSLYNTGDILWPGDGASMFAEVRLAPIDAGVEEWSTAFDSGTASGGIQPIIKTTDGLTFGWKNGVSFMAGTAKTATATANVTVSFTYNGTPATSTLVYEFKVVYNGTDSIHAVGGITTLPAHFAATITPTVAPHYYASSTKAAPNDLYIDLDIGEAYKIVSGQTLSANSQVSIPAQLPYLPPGVTSIYAENTVTTLTITPRWWEL